jgi:Secretion system C-terminal sorting domain
MKKIAPVVVGLLFINSMYAQQQNYPQRVDTKITVITPKSVKVTQSPNLLFSKEQMVKIENEIAREKTERSQRKARVFEHSVAEGPQYGNDAASIQTTMGKRQAVGVKAKWAGLSGSSQPLDPTGSVGMTQYVQSINVTPFAVYDKAGTGTPTYQGSVGTITNTGTDGDPVVVYDKFADRWCITQMSGSGGDIGFAVSKTNNPSGAWTAYRYTFASGGHDYEKFSVWSDGYYMTANNGGSMMIFDRAAMITGSTTAKAIQANYKVQSGAGGGFFLSLPGDADGLIPPAGLRCPMFAFSDNGWGGSFIDGVQVWSVGTTWGATPTANVTLDATIPVAAFDASYTSGWTDITQPGSQKVDAIGGICMYRAQWNNFIGTNRVALCWSVKIATGIYGTKWVELWQDQTSKVWTLHQEGIYHPDATASQWLGSIAMDCNGDIALGYSKASSSVPVSLCYTGRLANDPLGQMTISETIVWPGSGSINSNRIGDYSQLAQDPADPTTFWYTGTYAKSGTRAAGIFSFQLATACVTDVANNKPVEPEFSVYQAGNSLFVRAAQLPSNDNHRVQLFDVSGKLISEKSISVNGNSFETTLDAGKLSAGVYIVRIGTADFQRVKKIIIQ